MNLWNTISNLWKPRKVGDTWFYSINSSVNVWEPLSYLAAFEEIPEINAVISLKARSFCNGVIKAVDKNGKGLEGKVPQSLQFPNWFQGQKEFLRQTKLFHEIYGDEFLYLFFGVGLGAETTKAIYTIPPNLVEVEYLDKQPFFVHTKAPNVRYSIVNGDPIPTEQLIHLNDNRVCLTSVDDKKLLRGESKMKGIGAAINNLRMAYEARGVILRTRGATGILSNNTTDVTGSIPLDPIEKQRVQEEFRNYGTLNGQNHTIITSANLRWQKMGVNPSELGLFQETEADFYKACDVYGTPVDLFAQTRGATFENQKQAEKGLYLRTIIPEANEWISAINKSELVPEGVTLVMDYSHLSVFQEDLKMRGEALTAITNALSKMLVDGVISVDEYKEEISKYGIGKANA